MRMNPLGTAKISAVGFGSWEAGGGVWGENESDEQVIRAIRAGLDAGITWIDTAEIYGRGRSEELVGLAIEGREAFVATKVAPRPAGTGFRAREVRRACESSLGRLGLEAIDLYQLHWTDETGVPIEETWEAMAGLAGDGLVRHIGVSNFDRDLIEACAAIRRVDSLQPHFSMLYPRHRDLIRWCGERGIAVVAYGPLAYGLLTGAIDEETEFADDDWRSGSGGMSYYRQMFAPGKIERSLAVVAGLRPIAERLGISVAQLALAWTSHQPGVTSAIAGTRNPEHARANAEAGEVELRQDVLGEIEALLPLGPAFG